MTSVQAACSSKDAARMLLAGMYDSKVRLLHCLVLPQSPLCSDLLSQLQGQSLATSPFGPVRGPAGGPGISSCPSPCLQKLLMVGGSGAASPPASEVSARTKPSSQMRDRMAAAQALARQHMALGLTPAQTVVLWGSAVPQPSALLQGKAASVCRHLAKFRGQQTAELGTLQLPLTGLLLLQRLARGWQSTSRGLPQVCHVAAMTMHPQRVRSDFSPRQTRA